MSSYWFYVDRFIQISLSMFQYDGLPDSVDVRYLETSLFKNGCALIFEDDVMGLIALDMVTNGNFNIYGEPIRRRAYSRYNNFQIDLTDETSVIMWNNRTRTQSYSGCVHYAKRLWELDRIIDQNARNQKAPFLITCDETQRLTMKNLYQQWDGMSPVIYGDKNLDLSSIQVLRTDAPFVGNELNELKNNIWNEALTFLGIANVGIQKKERQITDEVLRNQGGAIASRLSRLSERQKAIEKVNEMFGTEITVDFAPDFDAEFFKLPESEVMNE